MKSTGLNWITRALIGGFIYAFPPAATPVIAEQTMFVFIGTYTGAKSKGIYRSEFDPATGALSAPELAAEAASPSFLAIHPNGRFLYAVGETSDFRHQNLGSVSAFSLNAKVGKLTLLNQQSSGGGGPCHLAVDRSGKYLLVANYGTGSIAALPIQPDGGLGEPSAVIQHQGSSANPQRQSGPHAHYITTDPANHFVLACDLGLDKVLIYRFDPGAGSLVPNDPPALAIQPGSGPRHLAFYPSGRFVCLINELNSTLGVLRYDPQNGSLKEVQTVSSLPADFKSNNSCAEVQVHPSGKFVYGSNRGHDSIAVFALDPKSGRLSSVQYQSTQGKTPRNFALDPFGKWLLAANQDSDNVVVFQVDQMTGRLSPNGQSITVGMPVCLEFVARK
jgi:6-phosphogluconolactonase